MSRAPQDSTDGGSTPPASTTREPGAFFDAGADREGPRRRFLRARLSRFYRPGVAPEVRPGPHPRARGTRRRRTLPDTTKDSGSGLVGASITQAFKSRALEMMPAHGAPVLWI